MEVSFFLFQSLTLDYKAILTYNCGPNTAFHKDVWPSQTPIKYVCDADMGEAPAEMPECKCESALAPRVGLRKIKQS